MAQAWQVATLLPAPRRGRWFKNEFSNSLAPQLKVSNANGHLLAVEDIGDQTHGNAHRDGDANDAQQSFEHGDFPAEGDGEPQSWPQPVAEWWTN